jgi:Thaumatin family
MLISYYILLAGCYVDLNPNCPADLRLKNSQGVTVGCKSACLAHGGASNCCTGAHDTRATCPTSGVANYNYFHGNCPKAYAYAYDDAIALFQCAGAPNYKITFCP